MQKAHNRFSILLLFLLLAAIGFSQDIIVKQTGERIYCRIVRVDSVSIFFLRPPQKREFEVKMTVVYRYEQNSKPKNTVQASTADEYSEMFVINFSAGAANPVEDFANKDPNSIKSGMAKNGYFLQSSVLIKLADYFGFSLTYHYQRHKFAHELIAEQYSAYYNAQFYSTADDWKIRGLFGGLHFTTPVKKIKHLSFDIDASAGLPKYTLPGLVLSVNSPTARGTVTQYSSTSRAPTLLAGIGLKYRTSRNFALSLNLNYLRGKALFTNIYTKSSNGPYSYDNYEQKVSSLNVQVGINFLIFEKKRKVDLFG